MYLWVYLIFLPAFSAAMMLNCLKSKPVCFTLFLALIMLLTVGSRLERFELLAEKQSCCFSPLSSLSSRTWHILPSWAPLELGNWELSQVVTMPLWSFESFPSMSKQVEGLSEVCKLLFMLCSCHHLCLNTFFWLLCSVGVHQDLLCAVILYCWVYFVLGNSAAEGPILTKSSCY